MAGNKEQAKDLQKVAFKLNNSISGKSGVAGVKAAMEAMGLAGGGLRKPLRKLPVREIENIKLLIKEYYPDGQ
jgi:4-hydroxy-2-oxoglutarate aldolase